MSQPESAGLSAAARAMVIAMLGRRRVYVARVLLQVLYREFYASDRLVEHWAGRAKTMRSFVRPIHDKLTSIIENGTNGHAVVYSMHQHRALSQQLANELDGILETVENGPNLIGPDKLTALEMHHQNVGRVTKWLARLDGCLDFLITEEAELEQDESLSNERLRSCLQADLFDDDEMKPMQTALEEAHAQVDHLLENGDGISDRSQDIIAFCLDARWDFHLLLLFFVVSPARLRGQWDESARLHAAVLLKIRGMKERADVVERFGYPMIELCISSQEWRHSFFGEGTQRVDELLEEVYTLIQRRREKIKNKLEPAVAGRDV